MEYSSSNIASRGSSYGIDWQAAIKVENSQKELKPFNNPRMILEEFEKDCGVASMVGSRVVNLLCADLIATDPAYVESIVKKGWMETEGYYSFFSKELPKLLVEAGHAKATVIQRSLELLNSKYNDTKKNGMELLKMVAEKDPWLFLKALSAKCSKLC